MHHFFQPVSIAGKSANTYVLKKMVVSCPWLAVHVKGCWYNLLCHFYSLSEKEFLTTKAAHNQEYTKIMFSSVQFSFVICLYLKCEVACLYAFMCI